MTLRPGESVLAFAHRLSQAAEVALPGLDQSAMDQLLVQRLLSAIPEAYRRHLLLESGTLTLQEAVGRLRSLMSFDSAGEMVSVTAVGAIAPSESRLDMLEQKIDEFSKQLASLGQQRLPSNKRAGCFVCGSVEHFARSCPRGDCRPISQSTVKVTSVDRRPSSASQPESAIASSRSRNVASARLDAIPHFTDNSTCGQIGSVTFTAFPNQSSTLCTVDASIEGTHMSVLLDSGSNFSLIALPAFLRLGKVDLMQHTTFKLVTASKQTLAVKGIVTLKLNIGQLECQTEFLVTETFVADVIVSVDFMAKHEVVIDFRRGLVYGPELGELKWINKGLKASLPEVCTVHTHDEASLPENECLVDCEVPNFERQRGM
ncbi:zinc knuckle [Trichuris suis]|nr:zinc knuckle [Trichuris suis]